MSLSKQIVIAILLTLLTTTTFAKKSELAKLPPLQEGKARIFMAVTPHSVDNIRYLRHDSDPLTIKRAYGDLWAIGIYSFYLMEKKGDNYEPLVKLIGYQSNHAGKGIIYMDVEPQEFSLFVYARDRQNFGVLRGLPTTINFEVKANQSYQLIVGIGRPEFKPTPPLEALVNQLKDSQLDFCNSLRIIKNSSRKIRESLSIQSKDLGLTSALDNFSCLMVARSKQQITKEKDLKKMAKHYSKKEEKLKQRLEERKQHEINVANGDPSGKKTKRKAIEDAKKRKKQEKAEKWKKIREEKAKQKQK